MLANLTVKGFLRKTAAAAPVPGGGSIAALGAAAAASLVEMVARLTIGKKGYDEVQEEMKAIAAAAARYRIKLANDIDRDAQAYSRVMAAYAMPKKTKPQQQKRGHAVEKALKRAASIPMGVAENALQVMNLAASVALHGNKNALSDAAAAVVLAKAAVRSAIYNVKINLGSIADLRFAATAAERIKEIESESEAAEKRIRRLPVFH